MTKKFKQLAALCLSLLLLLTGPAFAGAADAQPWYWETLGANAAAQAGLDGAGVTVAVIDSGVNRQHADLIGADISGYNFLGRLPDRDVTAFGDDAGHGTLVAGLLAATPGNGIGADGLTPGASLLMLRCFSALGGSANAGSGAVETVEAAVRYAIAQGADVINMSIGGTKAGLQALEPVFQEAADAGILLVAAAGNTGGTAVYYPAAFDCVTGVGWLSKSGEVSALSQRNATVFVVAPGDDILGPDYRTETGMRTDSGSSFAAPIVSALAIMAKQADPAIDTQAFRTLLQRCADDLGAPGYDEAYGYGSVTVSGFVQALRAPQPITYDCGGGELLPGDYDTGYQIGVSQVDLPAAQREGFDFAGWFTDPDCTEPFNGIAPGSIDPLTLYAGWEACPEPEPEPQEVCPLCGRTHTGFFGRIAAFTHRLIFTLGRMLGFFQNEASFLTRQNMGVEK